MTAAQTIDWSRPVLDRAMDRKEQIIAILEETGYDVSGLTDQELFDTLTAHVLNEAR